jgi:2,4-didehydro-3-deoxy-L-rhamnonate hydrolase
MNIEPPELPAVALGTFAPQGGGDAFPALLVHGRVHALAEIPGMSELRGASLRDVFDQWERIWPRLHALLPDLDASQGRDLSTLKPCLPLEPRQIICAGANYRRHVIELMTDHDVSSPAGMDRAERQRRATQMMDHRAAHGQPFAFVKPVSSLLGPGEDLIVPADSHQADWELELAVVIGRPCYRVSQADALDYVAGYTIANDISARDRLSRRDIPAMGLDFVAGKGAPGFCPLGPLIVPAAYVPDPQTLEIQLKLNGRVMQQESTADMIFPVRRLIEFLSTYTRLLPGDILSTGSPAGNGTHYNRFLQGGDVMEGRITGLGVQVVRCVAESCAPGAPQHRPFVPLPALENS